MQQVRASSASSWLSEHISLAVDYKLSFKSTDECKIMHFMVISYYKIHDHTPVSRARCYYRTSVTVFQICVCPGLSVGMKQLDIVSRRRGLSLISPNVMYRRVSVLSFSSLGAYVH